LVPEEEREERCQSVIDALDWHDRPVYNISAIRKDGTQQVAYDIMSFLEERAAAMADDPSLAEAEAEHRELVEEEARDRMEELAERREQRRAERKAAKQAAEDDDDDGEGPEIVYTYE